ncbi:MAG TPA: DinB family protein [Bryobacteraceae bacterium]|nr:DinB family protein [Bryobacteraceae bacterium]
MRFQLDEAIAVLTRTPKVLDAMFRGQTPAWLNCREAPETFSPLDVLGHLLAGEATDWIPRAKIILECGESRAFDPFDRFGFGDLLANRTVEEVLGQFAEARSANLDSLRALDLDDSKLELLGLHPELGRVNLRQLLATWVVHDLSHLAQIGRVMSRQYTEEVGPWRVYIPLLK